MVDQRIVLALKFLLLVFLFFESTFEQQQQERLASPIERAALLGLRSSLGLRSRDWPIKVDPCSVWNGIKCENGSVSEINISGFKRTRIGSQNPQFRVDSLVNLTRLKSFNASGFYLPGSIPGWFGQRLVSLQALDLSSCLISNAIPGSLGNLTGLTGLYLHGNNFTGMIPSSLGQLVGLSVLDLSSNMLTGSIPVSFGSLQNLTTLDLSMNFLFGSVPPGIGMLSKLQYLNLSSNDLTSSIPAQLGDLSNLVDLDLSFNSLSGSLPAELRGLRNLQRMLIGVNLFGGSLPVNLFPVPSQLQTVVLKSNGFSGAVPDVLWSMPRLRLLDISGQQFHWFSFVDLSGNYFKGRVPDYVSDNASLVSNCLRNFSNQRSLLDCTSFYTEKGLILDGFGLPNSTQPPAREDSGKSNRKGNATQRGVGVDPATPVPSGSSLPPPGVSFDFSSLGDIYTYQQLLLATSDFSDVNLIKHGHSGDLYKGISESGIPVVIKKIDLQSHRKEAYLLELDFFSKVSNPRLVPLVGHCLEKENEKFLIYKHMPNGDLSTSLYRKTNSEDGLKSLDWITRLKIAIGAAEGLSYLHHECTPPIVHRDVQASSILLDDKFEVRLGSLSEVCTQEGDTQHSRITRLLRLPQTLDLVSFSVLLGSFSICRLGDNRKGRWSKVLQNCCSYSNAPKLVDGSLTTTCTYDVYCFGKVLLELVTGKLGISASSDAQLKVFSEQILPYISIYDKGLVMKIVDPSLIIDEDLLEEVWAMAIVARSCLNPKPSRRPLMRYILMALENPLKVVREENYGSARLRATSSRSWNASLFGSWRHSSSDAAVVPAATSARPGGSSLKKSGTFNSQGSGQNNGGDHSSSHRWHSREIFPEPSDEQDVEKQD
ncbi:RECEPTOR-LIKE PROTEIN 55 [Salix viminalis]|uniref:RECEPTOR-LIKE PROTEIN 55 n=1 Tax=Salix viminalis TaxID=40686 RepID=A0A9Q0NKJ7_SALVM|nr:RECEPTOR-LIKE PROTEIN 55 [Salix viminalis]